MGAQPTYRTTLGFAKEATFGTPIAPTFFVPVTSVTPDDKLTLLDDKGWRGSAADTYGKVAGVTEGQVDFGGDVFADTIGFPLAGVLGDVAVTGASAPFTSVMAVLNTGTTQPPSYTLTVNDAISARQFAGSRFSEVAFKFDGNGKLEYTAKSIGFITATTTAPTPSFSAVPIMPVYLGVVKLGGTIASTVLSGELTIKRAVDPIFNVDGTPVAYDNWAGPVSADGKLTLVMDTDTYRAAYAAGTPTSVDINFTQGTGTGLTQVLLHASSVYFTAAPPNFGKTWVELDLTFDCVANVTDAGASGGYSPVKVTLQNAVPTGSYK